jgi:hypothetical protein
MTRRKREIVALRNERDFPHRVELALPLGPFRRVFLEIDAFHRERRFVLAGAEACARDLGRKQQWDKWARGCSAPEFVQIARVELELGKVYCDWYSQ